MATLGSNPATLKQSAKILSIFEDTPAYQVQAILESGFLADLRDADVNNVDRDEFRKMLDLKPVKPQPTIWKTIKLGSLQVQTLPIKAPEGGAKCHLYAQALESKKFRIGDYTRKILNKVTIASMEIEIDLAVVTVADLGFKRATRYDVICKRIVEIGAQLCPAEVGPALRLSYEDQPSGEYNVIAMEPLSDSDSGLNIFNVNHADDERWLDSCSGYPGSTWSSDYRFVVAVPRK